MFLKCGFPYRSIGFGVEEVFGRGGTSSGSAFFDIAELFRPTYVCRRFAT